jgi:hypothetical protein
VCAVEPSPYFCIAGGAVSQKAGNADITLTPSHSEVERSVSSKHFVSCTSPRAIRMKWMRNSTEVTASKGRYVDTLQILKACGALL